MAISKNWLTVQRGDRAGHWIMGFSVSPDKQQQSRHFSALAIEKASVRTQLILSIGKAEGQSASKPPELCLVDNFRSK
jgi:hypothetical protein